MHKKVAGRIAALRFGLFWQTLGTVGGVSREPWIHTSKIENLSFETAPRVSSIAARTEALVCSVSREGEQEDVSLGGFAFG